MGITEKLSALLPSHRESHGRDRRPPQTQALALREEFDRWLHRFFEEPWGHTVEYPGLALSEVRETGDGVVVSVQVPGFEASDLDITVGRRTLTVRGEHNEEGEVRRFVQRVTLPDGVDVDRAEAKEDRGVLTVRFPRTAPAPAGRRIHVSR
jgi:HSP20 family molecular chaperone IbpA